MVGCPDVRPIICLDGCHIKTDCEGIILTAVGLDANNCIYPIAYAVVEKEKSESWSWFLEHLMADMKIPKDTEKLTFMSDKQKGLIDAIEKLMPNSEHRFCVVHLYNNFKVSHKGLGLKNML